MESELILRPFEGRGEGSVPQNSARGSSAEGGGGFTNSRGEEGSVVTLKENKYIGKFEIFPTALNKK